MRWTCECREEQTAGARLGVPFSVKAERCDMLKRAATCQAGVRLRVEVRQWPLPPSRVCHQWFPDAFDERQRCARMVMVHSAVQPKRVTARGGSAAFEA